MIVFVALVFLSLDCDTTFGTSWLLAWHKFATRALEGEQTRSRRYRCATTDKDHEDLFDDPDKTGILGVKLLLLDNWIVCYACILPDSTETDKANERKEQKAAFQTHSHDLFILFAYLQVCYDHHHAFERLVSSLFAVLLNSLNKWLHSIQIHWHIMPSCFPDTTKCIT